MLSYWLGYVKKGKVFCVRRVLGSSFMRSTPIGTKRKQTNGNNTRNIYKKH